MCIIIMVPHHNVTRAKITFDNEIFLWQRSKQIYFFCIWDICMPKVIKLGRLRNIFHEERQRLHGCFVMVA